MLHYIRGKADVREKESVSKVLEPAQTKAIRMDKNDGTQEQ